jgi:hypothetical protein
MVIRPEQLAVFEAAASEAFEQEVAAACRQIATRLCEVAGDSALRAMIRFSLGAAKSHDFTFRGPLRFYSQMALSYGIGFDTDPQLPWAALTLADRSGSEMDRAERLWQAASDYRSYVGGPRDANTIAALRRLEQANAELMPANSDFRAMAMHAHPQKAELAGDHALNSILEQSVYECQPFALPNRGVLAVAVVKFAFGHLALHDPIYRWVRRPLEDPLTLSPEMKVERLLDRLRVYAKHTRVYLEQQAQSVEA